MSDTPREPPPKPADSAVFSGSRVVHEDGALKITEYKLTDTARARLTTGIKRL